MRPRIRRLLSLHWEDRSSLLSHSVAVVFVVGRQGATFIHRPIRIAFVSPLYTHSLLKCTSVYFYSNADQPHGHIPNRHNSFSTSGSSSKFSISSLKGKCSNWRIHSKILFTSPFLDWKSKFDELTTQNLSPCRHLCFVLFPYFVVIFLFTILLEPHFFWVTTSLEEFPILTNHNSSRQQCILEMVV